MFVDASAMIAIMTDEPGANALAAALDGASAPITSSVAIFEAALGISRKYRRSVAAAQEVVRDFLAMARVEVVVIGEREADAALEAFARYGKGRGHPAQLNLGDCFAYAVAKRHAATLLFKGDDFNRTDIEAATGSH